MLRRDFLKFMGLAGVSAAIPMKMADARPKMSPKMAKIPRNLRKSAGEDAVLIELTFDGSDPVLIFAEEGSFTYTEHREIFPLMERGVLTAYHEEDGCTEFSLDVFVAWSNTEGFHEKIRKSFKFSMGITLADDTSYTLPNCVWDSLQWDMQSGAVSITGRAHSMGVTK